MAGTELSRRQLVALLGALSSQSALRGADSSAATTNLGATDQASPAEIAAGVSPTHPAFAPGCPERYSPPGFRYAAATSGEGGTDFQPALQRALEIAGQPVVLGAHLYRIERPLVVPPEQKLAGAGLQETGLCFSATAAGAAIDWNRRNAAKIELSGFTLYGNRAPALSAGIRLGSGSHPYGTEGFIDQVMVRDLPANSLAFDVNCNIGEFGAIYALNTAGIRLLGSGISVVQMENTNASGFVDSNGTRSATEIDDGWVGFYEIEAPQSNLVLLSLRGNAVVEYLVPSLAVGTQFAELIHLGAGAGTWEVNVRDIYYGGSSAHGTQPTFRHLFFDLGARSAFGAGNPSGSSSVKSMCGQYSSGLTTHGATFAIKKQQLNAFTLQIRNAAGALEHAITAPGQAGVVGSFTRSVSGASPLFTRTPRGNVLGQFASGAQMAGTDPSVLLLNAEAQTPADLIVAASISFNNTGALFNVRATVANLEVNGVARHWLALQLTGAASGERTSWQTALAVPGHMLEVSLLGFFG